MHIEICLQLWLAKSSCGALVTHTPYGQVLEAHLCIRGTNHMHGHTSPNAPYSCPMQGFPQKLSPLGSIPALSF